MDERRITLVTGATRGIGRSIALRFAAEGNNIALFGRDKSRLDIVKDEVKSLGVEAMCFQGDVSDETFVKSAIEKIYSEFPTIDTLVNNAGIALFKKFTESKLEDLKRQVETNLYGVYNFTRAVIDNMISRNKGNIVNISSLAGKNGFIRGTMYAATKHAVMGFSKSLMLEVREYNIRVAAVCPGSVQTEMIINTPVQPNNYETVLAPEDVAEVVYGITKLPLRALVSEIEIRPTNPR